MALHRNAEPTRGVVEEAEARYQRRKRQQAEVEARATKAADQTIRKIIRVARDVLEENPEISQAALEKKCRERLRSGRVAR